VDRFLFDRQLRRDPVGYAVFENLESAVADLATSGKASVRGTDDGRLRSAAIVLLGAANAASTPCDFERLRKAVAEAAKWGDALAELVTTSDSGREWMIGFLNGIEADGIGCFRVSDLVAAIASRARDDWAARHAVPAGELAYEGQDESLRLVRLVRPDDGTDTRDLFEMLKRTVPGRIAKEQQARVRKGLTAVFEEWIRTIEDEGISRPNQAELARRLTMSAKTLSDYLQRLRSILREILGEKPDE